MLVGVAAVWAAFGPEPADAQPVTLAAPAPGDVRPDYLPDGEPVFVVGHPDGSVQVVSAFSTHAPQFLHKLVWWCPSARGFEDPFHGARWDEYGVYMFGPALGSLPSYTPAGSTDATVTVGTQLEVPGPDAPAHGPQSDERDWCTDLDASIYHTFEDWEVWESPSAAVDAAPDGWILIEGAISTDGGRVLLCSLAGCGDSAVVATVTAPPPETDPSTFGQGPRFIARARDGALVDLTQVVSLLPDAGG